MQVPKAPPVSSALPAAPPLEHSGVAAAAAAPKVQVSEAPSTSVH